MLNRVQVFGKEKINIHEKAREIHSQGNQPEDLVKNDKGKQYVNKHPQRRRIVNGPYKKEG
jgi:hypothetical protein